MLLNKKLPVLYTLKKIWVELIYVTLISTGIAFIDSYFNVNNYSLPMTIATIVGTAISLVLAFRTAQGYDRWWEARKIWGAIVNDSRTLTRQILHFNVGSEAEPVSDNQRKVIRRQIAWLYSLVERLRTGGVFPGLKNYISEQEYEEIRDHENIPNSLLQLHQKDLKDALSSGKINEYQQLNIDNTITRLTDHMGMCERIKTTVFPTMYIRITRFFIYLFIVFLSLGMVDNLGYVEAPVVIVIALAFFLLEKTGLVLADPFENRPSDVDILNISRNIERVLLQMMKEKILPDKVKPEKYYIM